MTRKYTIMIRSISGASQFLSNTVLCMCFNKQLLCKIRVCRGCNRKEHGETQRDHDEYGKITPTANCRLPTAHCPLSFQPQSLTEACTELRGGDFMGIKLRTGRFFLPRRTQFVLSVVCLPSGSSE